MSKPLKIILFIVIIYLIIRFILNVVLDFFIINNLDSIFDYFLDIFINSAKKIDNALDI